MWPISEVPREVARRDDQPREPENEDCEGGEADGEDSPARELVFAGGRGDLLSVGSEAGVHGYFLQVPLALAVASVPAAAESMASANVLRASEKA